jgi:hypothetical protein
MTRAPFAADPVWRNDSIRRPYYRRPRKGRIFVARNRFPHRESFPMRKRSSLAPFLFLALLFAGVWLYFTPYLALRKIQAAAERGDAETLNEMVDFPAFRESVKQGVRTAVSREISRSDEGSSNPFAAIGGMIAGALAGPMVDAFVTPEGIAALTNGIRPDGDGGRGGRGGSGGERERTIDPDVKITREYEGVDRFVIHFVDEKSGRERVALVMHRDGLADWKLSGVRLPAKN